MASWSCKLVIAMFIVMAARRKGLRHSLGQASNWRAASSVMTDTSSACRTLYF